MSFLKNIDLLGKPVNWQIEGRESFATSIGGFLSLIIYLGTLTLTWYFGKDIYERNNPKFLSITEYLNEDPVINLNTTIFAMQMFDYDGNIINDRRAFSLEGWLSTSNYSKGQESNITYTALEFNLCVVEDIEEPFYTKHVFKDFYCPRFNTSYGGAISSSFLIQPYLNVNRCGFEDEKKYGFKCYTDEEMTKKFGYLFYMDIRILNNFINPKNYDMPVVKNFIQEGIYMATTGSQYVMNIEHKIALLTSDTGLIFEDQNTDNFFQHEKTNFYTIATIEKGKGSFWEFQTMFQICFFISRNRVNYIREYLKIPDALANVGGFMGIIIEVIKYLLSFYLENEYSIFLYQNLFRLEVERKDDNQEIHGQEIKIELSDMKTLKEMNEMKTPKEKREVENVKIDINKDFSMNRIDDKKEASSRDFLDINDNPDNLSINKPRKSKFIVKPNIINKEVRNLIKYKEKKREIIVIGKCERFCFLSCCCKSKKVKYNSRLELIKNAEAEISKKFDVIENLKSQNQMRLLKKLLLNENQCYLLENRELHILNNDKNNKNTTISGELEDLNLLIEKQKTAKLFEYLKIKKQENSFSVVDTLLIKYLNEELKNKIKAEIDVD